MLCVLSFESHASCLMFLVSCFINHDHVPMSHASCPIHPVSCFINHDHVPMSHASNPMSKLRNSYVTSYFTLLVSCVVPDVLCNMYPVSCVINHVTCMFILGKSNFRRCS